ncbi:MAG: hypothetical protein CL908_18535 [Deltaproteobacteria bacterium]|nr:hypothetical protein [Deltaproteobacteria bacterium]
MGLLLACLLWSSVWLHSRHLDGIQWYTDGKTNWRDTYLKTGSISQANEAAGFPIHPAAEATKLPWKPDWLEQRRLSFFAGRDRDR